MAISPSTLSDTCSRETEQSQGCCAGGRLLRPPWAPTSSSHPAPVQPWAPMCQEPPGRAGHRPPPAPLVLPGRRGGEGAAHPKLGVSLGVGSRGQTDKQNFILCSLEPAHDLQTAASAGAKHRGEKPNSSFAEGEALQPSAFLPQEDLLSRKFGSIPERLWGADFWRGKKLKNCLDE